jgi:hypothetical protein
MPFYAFYRIRRLQQGIATDQRVPVLLHCQQRHEVRGAIVEAHASLCSPHRIGKRSAARYDHHAAGTRRERSDPIGQYCGESEAAAKLNDDRGGRWRHQPTIFGSADVAAG